MVYECVGVLGRRANVGSCFLHNEADKTVAFPDSEKCMSSEWVIKVGFADYDSE